MTQEGDPSAAVGNDFKEIIKRTLGQISMVEAGIILDDVPLVTTSKGLAALLPTNARAIREELRATWSHTYPDLFPRAASRDDFLAFENASHARGMGVQVWNSLLRGFEKEPEALAGLFFEKELDFDTLKRLHQEGTLQEACPQFGVTSNTYVGDFIASIEPPEEESV